ncbi:pyroglutamyl-peptidase 1 [Echinops telfairi]|uniref:Pyroglutamyl-peptidase 1 n=1 Tax=Echinops telfairi TaxID=9371 RepID=A0AC55DTV6_ECHTE|nr:pyroglutamyl-peptidase 1 [Echinops telfairi]
MVTCCFLATFPGFGPFGEHTVNASWIAVQELEKLGLGDSVDLHVYEIPVEYKTVQRLIPALWEKHSPQSPGAIRGLPVGVSGPCTCSLWSLCCPPPVVRYLCDFTYYTSLYQSHGRSAFVHVPPLGKPYNADQLGRALRAIIEEMLDVLEQSEGNIKCRHKH